MSFPDGTWMNESGGLRLKRLANAIPASYTIFKIGSTYYAETNIAGGTNYADPSCQTVFDNVRDALSGGGLIQFREGTFPTQLDVTGKENLIIQGVGSDYQSAASTVIQTPNSTNDDLFKVDGTAVHGYRVDLVLRDLVLNGNSANQTAGDLIGINQAHNILIERVQFRDAYQYAIEGTVAEQVRVVDSFVGSGGIYMTAGNAWYILRNEIAVGNSADGITVYSTSSEMNTIAHNTIYLCRKGIHVYNTVEYLEISKNKLWENYWSGIDINASCSKILVDGNHILSNDKADVGWSGLTIRNDALTLCQDILVVNNIFNDYQGAPTQTYHVKFYNDTDYITLKNNVYGISQTDALFILGGHNVFDRQPMANASLDLSGGATDILVFHAKSPCILAGYSVLYTEASSADVDWPVDAIRVGRYQDGVALDDDYFDETVSEASKNKGYVKHFVTADLTQTGIAAGDSVTVGTGGGKTGGGEVCITLHIAEGA